MSREDNAKSLALKLFEESEELVRKGVYSDDAGFKAILLNLVSQIVFELAAQNDLAERLLEPSVESVAERVDLSETLKTIEESIGRPAVKRLQDFTAGDEVWVKVVVRNSYPDEDGEVKVETRSGCGWINGDAETRQ